MICHYKRDCRLPLDKFLRHTHYCDCPIIIGKFIFQFIVNSQFRYLKLQKISQCLCSIKYLRRCMLQFLNGSWNVIEYVLVSLCATIWQMDLMFCSCYTPEYILCAFIIYHFTKYQSSYFIQTLCMSQYRYLYNVFYYRDMNLTCIVWMINTCTWAFKYILYFMPACLRLSTQNRYTLVAVKNETDRKCVRPSRQNDMMNYQGLYVTQGTLLFINVL